MLKKMLKNMEVLHLNHITQSRILPRSSNSIPPYLIASISYN